MTIRSRQVLGNQVKVPVQVANSSLLRLATVVLSASGVRAFVREQPSPRIADGQTLTSIKSRLRECAAAMHRKKPTRQIRKRKVTLLVKPVGELIETSDRFMWAGPDSDYAEVRLPAKAASPWT
jgi:hypothetical protein